jgi:hypothetical protein
MYDDGQAPQPMLKTAEIKPPNKAAIKAFIEAFATCEVDPATGEEYLEIDFSSASIVYLSGNGDNGN